MRQRGFRCRSVFRSDHTLGALLAVLLVAALAGCSAVTAPPHHQVEILVRASPVWPATARTEQLATAQKRFAECGIALTFVAAPSLSPLRELSFIESLEAVDGRAIEGRALTLVRPQRADIAWSTPAGTPLDHKQTAAHELGHLFGLGHAPVHSINLMAPHGCKFCRFSPGQCEILSANAPTGP